MTKYFMGQNWLLVKHLKRQCRKKIVCIFVVVGVFGGCQLHCHLLEAAFVDLFFQQSSYCGDEA
jgi:hypothetical protein